MANEVFANGREISCKKADGKTICAFPDICMTPPTSPATPTGVPIPYPNTGLAKDTTKGSRSVKISGKEIIKKNVSYYKTSYGDEAGCATPAKKGIITGTIKGKVYFTSWSMDVKVEGKNAVRHLDTTTHNHGSSANECLPWPYIDRMTMAASLKNCKNERRKVKDECKADKDGNVECPDSGDYNNAKKANDDALAELKDAGGENQSLIDKKKQAQDSFNDAHMDYAKKIQEDPCNKAAQCMLVSHDKKKCCAPQTPHHLVFKASFKKDGVLRDGCENYNDKNAPCICATGGASTGAHGLLHSKQKDQMVNMLGGRFPNANDTWSCGKHERVAAQAVNKEFPQCSRRCIQSQLRSVHQKMGIDDKTEIGMVTAGASEKKLASLRAALRG